MIGAVVIVVVLLVMPVAFFLSGGVVAATLGQFLTRDIEAEFEGTEYVELS